MIIRNNEKHDQVNGSRYLQLYKKHRTITTTADIVRIANDKQSSRNSK